MVNPYSPIMLQQILILSETAIIVKRDVKKNTIQYTYVIHNSSW